MFSDPIHHAGYTAPSQTATVALPPPCASLRAILDALANLAEAEELVEVLGGFRGRVRPSQRKASAAIDRALAELEPETDNDSTP